MTYVSLSFVSWLQEMFNSIINAVLVPVLKTYLYVCAQWMFGIWSAFIYRLLMRCMIILLKIVYIVEQIFDIFACTRGVYVRVGNTDQYVATTSENATSAMDQNSLLDVLFRQDVLTNVMLRITLAAFALCILFTIFAVIRSMGDSLGENKKPVTHVIRETARACLYFLLTPLVVIMGIKTVGVCTSTIVSFIPANMNGTMANSDTRICDVIFYVSVGDAFRHNKHNYVSGQNFQEFDQVLKDVDITIVNYPLALIFIILMLLVLITLILQCIIRIFALLVLFIVSPYFVAMIPLDDGQKFKRWREMFVAFAVSTFGPIITMRFYLSLVAFAAVRDKVGEHYTGFDFGTGNDITEFICLIIFIVGGAYAVWKSQDLIVSAVDPEAASTLQKSMMLMNFAMSKITGGISDTVSNALNKASGDSGGGGGQGGGGQGGSSGGGGGESGGGSAGGGGG